MAAPRIKIMLVDDHTLVRMGLAAVLTTEREFRVVAQAEDAAEALAKFREHRPDVTLMDLRMPGGSGLEAMRAIHAETVEARVIMLTTSDTEDDIARALDAGARGYLLKNARRAELVAAIRRVHAGGTYLPDEIARRLEAAREAPQITERDREILSALARGLTNREIAIVIGRSEDTVKANLKALFTKLGVADRAEAVAVAMQRGLIEQE